jgi:hypothetical protein
MGRIFNKVRRITPDLIKTRQTLIISAGNNGLNQ